jgi:predicted RNA-binding Zn-ribbon protein involved in translation (DUF1610 family)
MADESTRATREGHCPQCGEVTTIRVTIDWQDDICADCGASVPDE